MLNKLKKTTYLLGLSSVLWSSLSFSSTYMLTPGLNADFDFPHNSPQVLTNYFFWTITATCHITTPDNSDDMHVKMLSNSAKVNGVKLRSGDVMTITLHTGDRLEISADAGAKVELTNQGANTVKASCSTKYSVTHLVLD